MNFLLPIILTIWTVDAILDWDEWENQFNIKANEIARQQGLSHRETVKLRKKLRKEGWRKLKAEFKAEWQGSRETSGGEGIVIPLLLLGILAVSLGMKWIDANVFVFFASILTIGLIAKIVNIWGEMKRCSVGLINPNEANCAVSAGTLISLWFFVYVLHGYGTEPIGYLFGVRDNPWTYFISVFVIGVLYVLYKRNRVQIELNASSQSNRFPGRK